MRFYCIGADQEVIVSSLRLACEKFGLKFFNLDPVTFDYSTPPRLNKGDILYRALTGENGRVLEKFLLTPEATTFYSSYDRSMAVFNYNSSLYDIKGVAQPRTIPLLTTDRELLRKYTETLGGFPLIIKVVGGSHGVGVLKVDSFSSLFSIVDYLVKNKVTALLRQFITAKGHARLIVLGDMVAGSLEYLAQGEDFRTNVGEKLVVRSKKYSDETEQLACRAVKTLGLEFGGVDIIIDEVSRKNYVLEVNFPCYFPRVEMISNESISEKIVSYLINKSKRAL